MNNAEKFKQVFGLYATELWSMPESDFLEWLNRDVETTQTEHIADTGRKVEQTGETAQNVQNEDLISRKWLVECIEEGWVKFDTAKDCNRMIHLVRDIAPSVQPEQNAQDGDLISREAEIEALARMMPRSYTPDGSHPADEEIFRAQEVFADCIEALEILPSAQPATNCSEIPNGSDDTISRRAAIDVLDEQIEQCNKALSAFDISLKDEYAVKVEKASLKAYKEQLENMPSAQPEVLACGEGELSAEPEQWWIPCSERLPEIGEYVLCYLKGRRYFGQYRVCKYCAADKYVNHPYFDFNENGFPNVVAWMPLPAPYEVK